MILVSIGNLGDLLIQAAFLRKLDRSGVSVAVPESYRSVASELFPRATIIGLDDRWSDGRILAAAQIDRATAVASIIDHLRQAHPGEAVTSIALTDDLILQRSLNIYDAYWQLLNRNRQLAQLIAPDGYPSADRDWLPLEHLPRWNAGAAAKTVFFCPWGGIGVKNIAAEDLERLRHAVVRAGFNARLLASTRDDVRDYPSFFTEEVVTLSSRSMIHDAVTTFAAGSLIVAVDTAWYHLAAIIGAPVLGIPGPRSLGHFEFPGRKQARTILHARLDCVDCFSIDRCALNSKTTCDAKPTVEAVRGAMFETLGIRRSLWQRVFAR